MAVVANAKRPVNQLVKLLVQLEIKVARIRTDSR